MQDGKRWITWKGRRILVNANGNIVKDGYNIHKKFIKAEKLSLEEYNKLKDDFEKSLTEDEKRTIDFYKISPNDFNRREADKWKETYRYIDKNSPKGYRDIRLSDLEAYNKGLDKEALKIKTNNKENDKRIKLYYDRMKSIIDDVNKMDKVFEKKGVSLDKDIIVYRKGLENLEDIEKGYVRPGYTSTSAMSRINKKTPGGLILGDNEFEIIVPKGMKFLPVENIGEYVPEIARQHEIILPRNIRFKLINDKSTEASFDRNRKRMWKNAENRYFVRAEEVINE